VSIEKHDRSKETVSLGESKKENKEPEAVNISEKMNEIRAIEAEEAMVNLYGKDKIKPLSENQANVMSAWGYKKRSRFAELLDQGKTNLDAFDIVENKKGIDV